MTTRILTLVGGFALCVLLACSDSASGQPPPPPVGGTVLWHTGYPQPYDPVGAPMPQKGGVTVFGTYAPAVGGWMVGTAELSAAPKAGGVTKRFTLERQNNTFGTYDVGTNTMVPAKASLDGGEYNVWVTVTFGRMNPITGLPESSPVSTPIVKVVVK